MKPSTQECAKSIFNEHPILVPCLPSLMDTISMISTCFKNGNKLLVCGNGGSATDAQHIVGELMKSFLLERPLPEHIKERLFSLYPNTAKLISDNLQAGLPTISLVSETALMTAYSNDACPELVFAQQVLGYGVKGDILLSISTSGNSPNILRACEVAKALDLKVIGLTGMGGGLLRNLCDIAIIAPGETTFRIQEYHIQIYHTICRCIEHEFFGAAP